VKTSWEILTRKTEKEQGKITERLMFDRLRGWEWKELAALEVSQFRILVDISRCMSYTSHSHDATKQCRETSTDFRR